MQCYELGVDNRANREEVEGFHEPVVDFLIVFVDACRVRGEEKCTFCLEVEEGSHLTAFVVASEEEHLIFEADLAGYEKKDSL